MLYTRKGDTGTTKTLGATERISKNSTIAEALGSLDEVNSYLGFCKVRVQEAGYMVSDMRIDAIVHDLQQTLFIIQAEVAGSDMTVSEKKVKDMEEVIDAIEKTLPPITTFFISGGTECAALFEVVRTISRRAERRVVAVVEEGKVSIGQHSLAYLNRLSSILYALARLSNHLSGINEESPTYNR